MGADALGLARPPASSRAHHEAYHRTRGHGPDTRGNATLNTDQRHTVARRPVNAIQLVSTRPLPASGRCQLGDRWPILPGRGARRWSSARYWRPGASDHYWLAVACAILPT